MASKVGNELLQPIDRKVGARREDHRLLDKQGDRSKLRCCVIGWIFEEVLVLGMCAHVADDELVTVRRCPRDMRDAGNAADASHVLDQNRLAQSLAHLW